MTIEVLRQPVYHGAPVSIGDEIILGLEWRMSSPFTFKFQLKAWLDDDDDDGDDDNNNYNYNNYYYCYYYNIYTKTFIDKFLKQTKLQYMIYYFSYKS